MILKYSRKNPKQSITEFSKICIFLSFSYLLDHGARLNKTDNDEWAPIHIASYHGHLAVVKLLHAAGAGLNMRIDEGATPLFMASQNGHDDVVDYLLKNGMLEKVEVCAGLSLGS